MRARQAAPLHYGKIFESFSVFRPLISKSRPSGLLLLILLTGWTCYAQTQPLTSAERTADRAYQQGMALLRAKQYPEALAQFKQVEQATPRLPQGYTGEGIALALMGKPEQAVAPLKKALELDPAYWVARRELGIIDWKLDRKDEAAKELQAVVKLFPNDPAVNVILGQYEFENKRFAQANGFFSKASPQVAANPRLSIMAAEALIKTGRGSEAAASLEMLSRSPGLGPPQQFKIAWLLGEAKDYPAAIRLFNALPQDFPDAFGRGYGVALAYFEQKQYPECIKTLTDLKARRNVRPALFSLLGAAQEKNGQTLKAYDAFRQGILQFPHDDENYLNIATLSVEHLNYDVSNQVLTTAIREIPGDHKLFLARGVVHTLRKEMSQAQADYEKALALAPDESSVYVALGICLMDQDKFADAARILRQGVQKQLKDVLLYYFLADALFRQGVTASSPLYPEALAAVEEGLKLDPKFAYGYLQRGRLELIRDQTTAAVADLEHARSLAPDSRAILYQLGVAYRRAGRQAEAAKLFARVAQASKEEAAQFRKGKLMEIMLTVSGSKTN
ncbi:MAG TPA: tetratricopeptide repeat protein [Terriglobia bacterium]|nr:tetratricopeptide repeat protein [Terriglobia bacterium]